MYRQRAKRGEKLERTQISLTKEERELVQQIADREGVSVSLVIRDAIRHYCAVDRSSRLWEGASDESNTGDPWERFADIFGMMDSGDPLSPVDREKIIYD